MGDPICVISNGFPTPAIAVQLSRNSIALQSYDDLRLIDQKDLLRNEVDFHREGLGSELSNSYTAGRTFARFR
jgi:hypothetical protein